METKEQLVGLIRSWIENDNEIQQLQKALKEKKEIKKNFSAKLVDVMKSNEIDCFDIKNGKLLYTQTKTKQALSKKVLLDSFAKFNYFEDKPDLAENLMTHILESRNEKINEGIRRKGSK